MAEEEVNGAMTRCMEIATVRSVMERILEFSGCLRFLSARLGDGRPSNDVFRPLSPF